jgi:hypothetical protein
VRLGSEDLRIAETMVGRGIFLNRSVPAGTVLLDLTGSEIDFAATLRMGAEESCALQIGPNRYLDLDPPGRYVNHSCRPNAAVRSDRCLVSLVPLKAGAEVRFDYSTTMEEDHWTMACACGEPECRELIRDFRLLPRQTQLQLVLRDAVPDFILQLAAFPRPPIQAAV